MDFNQNGELDQYSQEFRLISNGSSDFTWVAGFNYSYDELSVADDALLLDSAGVNLTVAYTQKNTSWGMYLHNEYELSDRARLIGGLRYSNDKRQFDGGPRSTDGSDFFGAIEAIIGEAPVAGQQIISQHRTETESNVSGKIGIDYDLSENTLLYANVSTSYKAGLFYAAGGGSPGVLDYVKPEEVVAYEVGVKTSLMDDSLRINTALYQYDYENRQSLVVVIDPLLFLSGTLANVPKSVISGGEVDFWWKPVNSLDIRGGVAYIDTEVENDLNNSDVRNLELFGRVPAGTALSQAPQWSFNFLLANTWNLESSGSIRAQLDYSWVDKQFAALADPLAVYGPIKSLGARLSWVSSDQDWEMSLWGKNIADQISDTYSFTNNSGARTVYRQQPRSYGIDVRYYFN